MATPDTKARTLWTIGHSTRPWDVFLGMLGDAGISTLVDVRRFAGSRRNPQFSGEVMARELPIAEGTGLGQAESPSVFRNLTK